jgi:nitroreductase
MIQNIIQAVDSAQRAQRNYDLSKTIPTQDLKTLIYAAVNSPSKQNETHYSLQIYTDQSIIKQIYDNTKKFTINARKQEKIFGVDENGKYWQDDTHSVKNSQILANVLFVYVKEEGIARCVTHAVAKEHRESNAMTLYDEQISISVGISAGELILSAGLLGYKTGICSAMNEDPIKKLLGVKNKIKLLVGVGYPNIDVDRRLHSETLNRDLPERLRNGDPDEHWKFPSFEKNIKVTLNGECFGML